MAPGRNVLNFLLAMTIVIATFAVDLSTPRGFAVGVFPHFIAIGVTAWSKDWRIPLLITALATVALLGGFFLTEGGTSIPVLFNRISLVVAFWIMAWLVLRKQDSDIRLVESNAALEQEVAARTFSLKTLADRLKLATQSAGIGIWEWDLSEDRLVWDERMHEIHGTAPERFTGTLADWESTWHPEDRYRMRREIAEARAHDEDLPARFRITRPDGTVRTLECHGQLRRTANGARMTGVCRDITEIARIELELQQAQKMEAIGQLTGGIAHDFNNLLAVILGNLELLEDEIKGSSAARVAVDGAMQSTLRGADLTQRLLAFARKQPLQPETTDINALVTGIMGMLRRSVREDIAIETELAPSLPPARVDPHQLENALLNLVINARDAMPGGGTVTISTTIATRETETGNGDAIPADYVLISVADKGTGMAPEVLSQAFEPFFTTKDVGTGSGLGLSMVYGLIKQSGGHIEMTSQPGDGTCCTLLLPVAAGHPENAIVEADPPVAGLKGGNETILVVEDDAPLRNFLRTALTMLGYTIVEAEDGPDAIARLAELPDLDLLFTDMVMPNGLSGVQVAQAARQRFPQLPVLYSSGYPRQANGKNFEIDADIELLPKPYTKATLALAIRRILDAP